VAPFGGTTTDFLAAIWAVAASVMLGLLLAGAFVRWRRDTRLGIVWIECPGCGAVVRRDDHLCDECGAEIGALV